MPTLTRNAKAAAIAAAAALVLTACAGGGGFGFKIYGERFSPKYYYDDLAYLNGGKEMTVRVLNSPFTGTKAEDIDERLATAMRNKNEGAPIAFTANPGPNTPPETRILIAFNTPSAEAGSRFCSGSGPNLQSGEPPLRMLMVYCKRDEFMSSVRAEAPGAQSLEDPDFKQMLALATRKLIPIENPYNENSGDRLKKIGG